MLQIKFLASFIFILSFSVYSQEESYIILDDVVISASRYEQNQFNTSEAISLLDNQGIILTNSMNIANLMFGSSGVWMQQTNNGGGSPIVRGLTGNQTLIMIDGIRLNNSTFRYGPNQYLNTINLNNIQKIEVMRGSGSVQYGSDALGGTVHVISKIPKLNPDEKSFNLGLNTKYLSANMERSAAFNFDYFSKSNSFSASVSYKNFGDILAGGDIGKLIPSSYDELALDYKSLHKISNSYLLTLSYNYVKQSDVDRYDQVVQRGYEYYKFDPQIRHLAYMKNSFTTNNQLFKDIVFTLSWQQSDETRKKKKEDSEIKTIENDLVNVMGTNLEVTSLLSDNWKANSGIEYYYDYVESSKENFDLSDNTSVIERGLYSDGSIAHSFSVYNLHNIKLGKTALNFGLRYNINTIDIKDNEFGNVLISPIALTGHLSLQYYLTEYLQLISKVNTAYRTPNINDLSSFGSFDYGIEVPNNNLDPEQSLNLEIGLKAKSNRLSGSIFVYRNKLYNLIDRIRTTYNGDSTYQGENVYTKFNVGEAYIQGIEGELTFYLSKTISLYSNLNYTYGQNISKNEPMRRIPPLNGNLSLKYNKNLLKFSLEYLFALKQDRLSSGDIDDHRIQDGGTPEWHVFNFYSSYRIKSFTISTGLLNIFNEAYRVHGSGIDGIGRSIFVGLKYQLK
ncbi:MAG: TonB-dependent receptor [Bacteroidetes bacterium]|nr:MAG: TonB-dependent receptor [Bacteroidota bacterium]